MKTKKQMKLILVIIFKWLILDKVNFIKRDKKALTVDGFIKDNKLIHYGKNISARVLDTKAKTLGTFMLDTNIEMKVSETLKEIERHIVYAATNKQNKINPTEVVNNDFEESMLNEKTEELLETEALKDLGISVILFQEFIFSALITESIR